MKRCVGRGLEGSHMRCFHVLRMHDPPSTLMCNYQPGKLTWSLVSWAFIGVSLHTHDWLSHWPHDGTHLQSSSNAWQSGWYHVVHSLACLITWLVFLVWLAPDHSDPESSCQQKLRYGSWNLPQITKTFLLFWNSKDLEVTSKESGTNGSPILCYTAAPITLSKYLKTAMVSVYQGTSAVGEVQRRDILAPRWVLAKLLWEILFRRWIPSVSLLMC